MNGFVVLLKVWTYAKKHCTIDPNVKSKNVLEANQTLKNILGKETFQFKDVKNMNSFVTLK